MFAFHGVFFLLDGGQVVNLVHSHILYKPIVLCSRRRRCTDWESLIDNNLATNLAPLWRQWVSCLVALWILRDLTQLGPGSHLAERKYIFIIAVATVCLKHTLSVTSDFRQSASTWRTFKTSNVPMSASSKVDTTDA